MNQKAKPHKRSLVVGDQNDILVLGLCCFVSKEFDHNDLTLIALYYGKIGSTPIFWGGAPLRCSIIAQKSGKSEHTLV